MLSTPALTCLIAGNDVFAPCATGVNVVEVVSVCALTDDMPSSSPPTRLAPTVWTKERREYWLAEGEVIVPAPLLRSFSFERAPLNLAAIGCRQGVARTHSYSGGPVD